MESFFVKSQIGELYPAIVNRTTIFIKVVASLIKNEIFVILKASSSPVSIF